MSDINYIPTSSNNANNSVSNTEQSFPYNVRPDYITPSIREEELNVIKNPPSYEAQYLSFKDSSLIVEKGYEQKLLIEMKNFFKPADEYVSSQLSIPITSPLDNTLFTQINFTGKNKGKGLIIFNPDCKNLIFKKISEDDTKWRGLGILYCETSEFDDIEGIQIKNISQVDSPKIFISVVTM